MQLQDYRPMMERCSNCLGCKWSPFDKIKSQRFGENCPSNLFYKFHTYSARGKFQAAQGILDGDYGYTDALLEAATACMACGACDVACKITRYNLEPMEHNIALKHDAIERGHILPQQTAAVESLAKHQTMLHNEKKAERNAWADGLGLTDALKEPVDAVFFPGCKYSYDMNLRESARKAVSVLQAAGVKLGYLGTADMCCAGRAYQQGMLEVFADRADANIKAFTTANIKVIITPCADCYHALKRLYAERGLKIAVLHIVEYIAQLLDEGKLRFTKKIDKTVTYHDPCHLGRLGEPYEPWEGKEVKIMNQVHTWEPRRPRYNGAKGVYDAPRRVLQAIPGLVLVEMERIREYSFCCGAGGGCNENYPEFSAWTAGERMAEAAATGASAVVTACPWCEQNLSSAQNESNNRITVIDIIDLAASAL